MSDMGNPIGKQAGSAARAVQQRNELVIPYQDLRGWLAEAEKLGEVKKVKGASWQRDIGMAAEVVLHDEKAPCVVFEKIGRASCRERV